jgi:glucosylceramidase
MRLPEVLTFCLFVIAGTAAHAGPAAQVWVTSADARQRLTRVADIPITAAARDGLRIRVDPSRQYQVVDGFGASFTESSAWLMQQRMNESQRRELLRELFDPATGLGLSVTRIPIGASDFSITHGTYDDVPAGETDPELARFSIDRARPEVLPLLREARRINPDLKVFISPWSAPAWMKTSGSLITGRLDPKHYGAFARYFDKTIAAFEAEGVPIYAMTMQNEPHFEPWDYPGMRMEPAERAAFIRSHLGPMLASRWPKVKLFDWDHNWDQPESPLAVLADPEAREFVAGVAWHCYGGDVSAQSQIHAQHPDLETFMTECSGGDWEPDFNDSLSWMMQNLVIGNIRHWGRGAVLWNLALDEHSGPHLGGCGNCRGVVTILKDSGAVARNVEYYVLGHASRFVKPGARRIESDSDVDGLHTVAFRNPRGGAVLIVLNASSARREFSVVVEQRGFPVTLEAGSVATVTWLLPAGH